MLVLVVPESESFDDDSNSFVEWPEVTLELEHSLISISKWESRWNKPFLGGVKPEERTVEETIDYIKCMTVTRNVPDEVYARLTSENVQQITDYINASMTATRIFERDSRKESKRIITSEIIYYWMIALNIPIEFQKWHINRLLTLIKVCNIENEAQNPNKKKSRMSRAEMNAERRRLNAERRAQYNTTG